MVNVQRKMASELLEMARCYPIVTVIGPRQAGKTTLVKQCFPKKDYVSLEDPDHRELAQSDPRGFLNKFLQGAILDEIQRAPQLLSYLQGIVDASNNNGQFILTGSHQLALHEAISQSLAGRTAILKLLPLSLEELKDAGIDMPLYESMYVGSYPRLYSNNINPTKYYRDYLQTYVEKDVRLMINIKDISLFQSFIKLCAGRIGQVFNSQSISNELGVSHHTVNNWLSMLEASFLIFRLPPYFENFGKRIIKSPKLYFTDVGLALYLLDITKEDQIFRDPLKGSLVENFIILEVRKHLYNKGSDASLYYYRDSNQNEIDLVFRSANTLVPVEIKSSQTYSSHFLKSLKYFQSLIGARFETGFVIYTGEAQQKIHEFHLLNYKNLQPLYEYC